MEYISMKSNRNKNLISESNSDGYSLDFIQKSNATTENIENMMDSNYWSEFMENQDCLEDNDQDFSHQGQNFAFIHLLVLIFASVSLFLSWKYVYEVGAEYMKHKVLYK